jgi:hypothetical protein
LITHKIPFNCPHSNIFFNVDNAKVWVKYCKETKQCHRYDYHINLAIIVFSDPSQKDYVDEFVNAGVDEYRIIEALAIIKEKANLKEINHKIAGMEFNEKHNIHRTFGNGNVHYIKTEKICQIHDSNSYAHRIISPGLLKDVIVAIDEPYTHTLQSIRCAGVIGVDGSIIPADDNVKYRCIAHGITVNTNGR